MKIRMLETRRGCEDGFAVKRFHKHVEYDMADGLARAFINDGYAVKISEFFECFKSSDPMEQLYALNRYENKGYNED